MRVTSLFVWLIMNLHAACDKQQQFLKFPFLKKIIFG
jgi:hypothetical protein